MSGIYTSKEPTLEDLSDVKAENVSNNDIIQYNSTSTNWENKSDFTTDEINCRVLNVSQTADIGGRLANIGVASFVNDEFIFQNGISTLGDVVYIDNNNNKVGINKAVPDEDLDIAGTLRIEEDTTQTIRFYDTQGGGSPDENGRIEVAQDGGGGEIKLYTLETGGGTPQERLSVNRRGALSLSTDYGTAGSILTSQGSSSPPIWTEPYRMRVYKTSNQTIQDQTTTLITGWTKDTEVSTTQGATDYNTTLSRWIPSVSGIYHISVNVFIAPPGGTSTSGANILRVKVKLMSSASSGTEVRIAEYMTDYSDDGIFLANINFDDIVSIDNSNYYYVEVFVDRISGTAQVVSATDLTWFSAYKIG